MTKKALSYLKLRYDTLFAFCTIKATSGSSVATYPREKTGAATTRAKHMEGKLSGIGWKRKTSAMTARNLMGGRQNTNDESVVQKFEGNKILVG